MNLKNDFNNLMSLMVLTEYEFNNKNIEKFIDSLDEHRKKVKDKLLGDDIQKQLSQIEFDAQMITIACQVLRKDLSKKDYKLLGEKLESLGKEIKEISKLI